MFDLTAVADQAIKRAKCLRGQLLQSSKPPETTAIGGAHEQSGIDFPSSNAKGLKWTST